MLIKCHDKLKKELKEDLEENELEENELKKELKEDLEENELEENELEKEIIINSLNDNDENNNENKLEKEIIIDSLNDNNNENKLEKKEQEKKNYIIKLINNIQILKNNSDYRPGDIINKSGLNKRWEHSGNMVLKNEKYKDTILQEYLEINGLYNKINYNFLLKLVEKHNLCFNLPIPQNNEIVIHLRLGDYVFHSNFLSKNYILLINDILKNNNNINKITFVTCFSYGEWSKESLHLFPVNFKRPDQPTNCPLWAYTEEKQNKNIEKLTILLNNIIDLFPNIEINMYSNSDIDKDMCYCVLSKYFINDVGGFSSILSILHNLRKKEL